MVFLDGIPVAKWSPRAHFWPDLHGPTASRRSVRMVPVPANPIAVGVVAAAAAVVAPPPPRRNVASGHAPERTGTAPPRYPRVPRRRGSAPHSVQSKLGPRRDHGCSPGRVSSLSGVCSRGYEVREQYRHYFEAVGAMTSPHRSILDNRFGKGHPNVARIEISEFRGGLVDEIQPCNACGKHLRY